MLYASHRYVCVCHVNKKKVVVVAGEDKNCFKIFSIAKRRKNSRSEIVFWERGESRSQTTHILDDDEEEILRRRTLSRVYGPFSHIHDYKFIIIPYILPTTTSSSSSFCVCTLRRRSRSKEIFSIFSSTLTIVGVCVIIFFFLGAIELSARIYRKKNPHSHLIIIKCTTSGSYQIISHLTPQAFGRKRKFPIEEYFFES